MVKLSIMLIVCHVILGICLIFLAMYHVPLICRIFPLAYVSVANEYSYTMQVAGLVMFPWKLLEILAFILRKESFILCVRYFLGDDLVKEFPTLVQLYRSRLMPCLNKKATEGHQDMHLSVS